MNTYLNVTADPSLVALAVVIWVVAISIAFGFYIPVLRASGRFNGGHKAFAPRADFPERSPGSSDGPAPAPGAAPRLRLVEAAPAPAAAEPAQADDPDSPQRLAATPCQTPDRFSVLIVDDNAVNRQVLELILDSVGVAHMSVENGLEAVRAMAACAHHAVLMDIQMPVMDGFEATRRIRAIEAARGSEPASIIVVSANCMEEHITAARQAGADSHLAKPISAGLLIGQLEASAARLAA